jgi:hypothetical protein
MTKRTLKMMTLMVFFSAQVIKRICCGIFGSHTSQIYCQIQCIAWRELLLLFVLAMGFPWWWLKEIFTIIEYGLTILLHSMPNKNPIINRSTERKQRQLYRHHTKYKGKCRQCHQPLLPQVTPSMKREKNGGWGSLISKHPTILGHKMNAQLEDRFLTTHDPRRIKDFYATLSKFPEKQASHIRCGWVYINLQQVLISLFEYPRCYSSSTVADNVIIDSGALVCIRPHKSDFITYRPSGMKIKDLSSTNKVTSKGLIQWDLQDKNDHTVTIEAFGYHIPAA